MIYLLLASTLIINLNGQTYEIATYTRKLESLEIPKNTLSLVQIEQPVVITGENGIFGCRASYVCVVNNVSFVTTTSETTSSDEEKSTQGPFTGLEGHNFTEEPAIIYPNPVKDILHVKSTDPITVIEILNLHGEVEKLLYINETMDVSELPAGTYFARIHFENINDVQIEQILVVN